MTLTASNAYMGARLNATPVLSAPNKQTKPKSASYDPTLERSFRGHRAAVRGVSFNPNMKQVASASDDHIVTVWNFKPDLRAFRFVGHTV